MKQKIFNRGKGWYVFATNYKDENDKAYLNLYFPSGEPEYTENERGYSVIYIDIQEAKFTAYKGKIGLTVFKYEMLSEVKKDEQYAKFGGDRSDLHRSAGIQDDDLPFTDGFEEGVPW